MSRFPPPGSAASHYRSAERLIESVEENPNNAVALAAAHALLASAPRRARRTRPSAKFTESPAQRWALGDDEDGQP